MAEPWPRFGGIALIASIALVAGCTRSHERSVERSAAVAECGAAGAECCVEDACDPGLTCNSGVCSCVARVVTGHGFTCALYWNGTAECVGRNEAGQAGTGELTEYALDANPVLGLDDAVELVAGGRFACARKAGGSVVCWGQNNHGQLGRATESATEASPGPVVGLSNAVELSAGSRSACARVESGAVYCWGCERYTDWPSSGDDARAEGDSSCAAPRPSPAQAGSGPATELFQARKHACIRTSTGVMCWGLNDYGQLGDGGTSTYVEAVSVPSLDAMTALTAGRVHGCGLRADGQVECWGLNEDGQLGRGFVSTMELDHVPVAGLTSVSQIAAGGWHTCALHQDGTVVCWGDGRQGKLGNGSEADSDHPVTANGIDDAIQMAVGGEHTCVVRAGGGIWCWGDNVSAQLGTGQASEETGPVQAAVFSCPAAPDQPDAAPDVTTPPPDAGGKSGSLYACAASPAGTTAGLLLFAVYLTWIGLWPRRRPGGRSFDHTGTSRCFRGMSGDARRGRGRLSG